jgi:hypothetical protein
VVIRKVLRLEKYLQSSATGRQSKAFKVEPIDIGSSEVDVVVCVSIIQNPIAEVHAFGSHGSAGPGP